jgi:MFS family permease
VAQDGKLTNSTESEKDNIRSSDVVFLLFLTLINVLNYIDRQLLPYFANWIVPELGLSNTQFGLLSGLVFIFFYAIFGVFMGAIADRMNRTRLISYGLGFWSILTAVSGAAKGFLSLAVPRLFIGIGESVLTPAAMSILGDRFPQRWRGVALGVFGMGPAIGIGASLFIVAYLEPILGWRGCFYLLGSLGVILAIVMFFISETPRGKNFKHDQQKVSVPVILGTLRHELRSSPALLLTMIGSMFYMIILGASGFDMLWFVQERGFDKNEIAGLISWFAVAGGVIGNLVGGYGSDIFVRKTGIGRPFFLALILLMLTPLNLAYRLVEPENLFFMAGIFIVFFQMGCFYGPCFGTIQDLVDAKNRGVITGMMVMMLQLAAGISMFMAGVMIDTLVESDNPEPYSKTLLFFTLISFVSIPLFYWAGKISKR